jgi:hypothetical protein
MGNTQLLGYFLDKGERSAVFIQGTGVVSNYGVLFQVLFQLPSKRCLLLTTLPHAFVTSSSRR